MVAAEEKRIKERDDAVKERENKDKKSGKKVKSHGDPEHGDTTKKSGANLP